MDRPVAYAMVICDSIYRDEATGKAALVGLFDNIQAVQFPALHPRMMVFVSLTEARPNVAFKFEVVNTETDHLVVRVEDRFKPNTTPCDRQELTFQLDGMIFPEPGIYVARFWTGETIVIERPIVINRLPAPRAEERQ